MPSDDPRYSVLDLAATEAKAFLGALDQMPARSPLDSKTLRSRLTRPLGEEGVPAERVVRELVEEVRGGLHASAGGRFYGWVIGGSLPAALAADWLTASWDQNAATYSTGPAAALVEEIAGGWLKELLLLPAEASFAMVSGCQMAHATCLAAARHALLGKRGWNVEIQGLFSAPPIRVISSNQRHGSVDRALRLLGFGTGQIVELPVGANGAMERGTLEAALREGPSDAPTLVVLQAGDLNIGAYDPFTELVPLAKRHAAWVHVDGAFGLWAAACPRLRDRLKGAELADSWATDGHKWLNVPYDCGYAFVRDSAAHRASMASRASYISYSSEVRDQSDWNPEWSRRARGFPTYAALRELGRQGVADLVDRSCRLAHQMVVRLGRLAGAELLFEPTINQGLVRFLDENPKATEADHDRRTDAVVEEICNGGEALFSGTTWRGRRAMRVSVCGWQTTERDVERAVAAAARAIETVARR